MKRISLIFACLIIVLLSTTGCGTRTSMMVTLDGEIRLSESTDNITVKELEKRLQEVSLHNSEKPLFNKVIITENKGVFYNSYRFWASTTPQQISDELTLAVNMSGTPSGVRNGIIEGNRIVFPLTDLADPIELVAEFEENNVGVIFGIIAVLVTIMSGFFLFIKRGNGGGYDNY
ncbi:MAG TPA: hypothetical protein PLD22_03230 [Bacillota bacterium]|nr:hypothetical protein [Bacillota bacterium]